MPTDRPPGTGPYPLEPDTDESPPTEEVLDTVMTEEIPRQRTEDWYDPDAGEVDELPLARKLAPWVALLGAMVLLIAGLWLMGIISLPGMSADGGQAACERACRTMGTTVLRYSEDDCVCLRADP